MDIKDSIRRCNIAYMRAATALALSLIIVMSEMSNAQPPLESIDALQWQHRVILVHSVSDCLAAAKVLRSQQTAVVERDILWFVVCNDSVDSNFSGVLADQFIAKVKTEFFNRDKVSVVLIGKDGGIKLRANNLELAGLFDLIDSMPMRQLEIND